MYNCLSMPVKLEFLSERMHSEPDVSPCPPPPDSTAQSVAQDLAGSHDLQFWRADLLK